MRKQSVVADKLFIIFYVVILVLAFSQEAYTQKTKSKPQPTPRQPKQDSSTIGTVLDSASTLFSDDPYAQFRNASYSNEGLMSEQDEIKLSDELHKEISKKYKIISDGQPRVNRIGQKIVHSSLRSNLKYQFYVYDAKEINAFAIPGGKIYVASALSKIANDDELASVLSHEVGHIVARHSLHSLQEAQTVGGLADLVGSITGIAGQDAQQLGKMAAQLLATPYLLSHSREQEREADFLGVNNMFKASYKLEGMVTMFEKLQKLSKSEPSILGTFFSSHPDVEERIENTRYEINRLNKK
jgi:predicted Zn-dependent protease